MTIIRPTKELLQSYLDLYLLGSSLHQVALLTIPYDPSLSIEANLQNEVKEINGYGRQVITWAATELQGNTLAKRKNGSAIKFTATADNTFQFFGFVVILRNNNLLWANRPFTDAAINTSTDVITFTDPELALFTLSTAYKIRFVPDLGATLPTVAGGSIANVDLWMAKTSSTVVEIYYDQALTSKVNFTTAGSGGFKLQNIDNEPLGCFYSNQVAPVLVSENGYSLDLEIRLGSLPR